jgi:hypothetical protein
MGVSKVETVTVTAAELSAAQKDIVQAFQASQPELDQSALSLSEFCNATGQSLWTARGHLAREVAAGRLELVRKRAQCGQLVMAYRPVKAAAGVRGKRK